MCGPPPPSASHRWGSAKRAPAGVSVTVAPDVIGAALEPRRGLPSLPASAAASPGGVRGRSLPSPIDRGYRARRRPAGRKEASPSPVYGAALLMRFGLIPIPGSNPGASAVAAEVLPLPAAPA